MSFRCDKVEAKGEEGEVGAEAQRKLHPSCHSSSGKSSMWHPLGPRVTEGQEACLQSAGGRRNGRPPVIREEAEGLGL